MRDTWFETVGNMHMHTPYSDGTGSHAEVAAAAIAAGLDFIIVTDHNIWVDGLERYYETEQGKVLVLIGEEVHNVRRVPQASHFLAYGANRELAPYAANPQTLIDETLAAGGYGFLAHPFEEDIEIVNEPNYGWHDWDIDGFTGLEIWNYMSTFKNELSRLLRKLPVKNLTLAYLAAWFLIARPEKFVVGPEPEVLAKWDELLTMGKRVMAVGNSDAHATTFGFGPFERVVYPYEFCFRAVNTHLLLPEPLNGDVAHDKKLILAAIGEGRSWVGYDLPRSTRGFRFSGQGLNKGIMGQEVRLDAGATLQVKAPAQATIRLIRHGEVVAAVQNDTNLTHIPIDPGAYRVECELLHLKKPRGWIFSNPIFLV